MARWIFVLLAVGMTVVPAYACTCYWPQPIKACHLYQIKPVIFRAKVVVKRGSLHRVRVLENFKGLPARTAELLVSGGGMCPVELDPGRDYLIFAKTPELTATPASIRRAWTDVTSLQMILVSGCDPIGVLTDALNPDLAYLRSADKDRPGAPGWIEPRSVQSFDGILSLDDHPAAPGVRWTVVRQASSDSVATTAGTSDSEGRYRTPMMPPGVYGIVAEGPFPGAATLFSAFRRRLEMPVHVPAGGCASSERVL
jgi:hypothetical protein